MGIGTFIAHFFKEYALGADSQLYITACDVPASKTLQFLRYYGDYSKGHIYPGKVVALDNHISIKATYCEDYHIKDIMCAKHGKVMPTTIHVGQMIKVRSSYED